MMFIIYKFPVLDWTACAPDRSTQTFSNILVALCPIPSSRILGTGVFVCLPRTHDSHLVGLAMKWEGIPSTVPFLAMSIKDWKLAWPKRRCQTSRLVGVSVTNA